MATAPDKRNRMSARVRFPDALHASLFCGRAKEGCVQPERSLEALINPEDPTVVEVPDLIVNDVEEGIAYLREFQGAAEVKFQPNNAR